MTSILTDSLREDFFIKLYFDTKNGFYSAGIKRAFLDFSRTLVIKNEYRAKLRQSAENFIFTQLTSVTQNQFNNQKDFDSFHRLSCERLIDTWEELNFGQAQKWINMTLKYWLLFGDKRIKGIEKNAKYFHIPIDSYVQKGLFNEKNPKPWSKIKTYEVYFEYQQKHRDKETGNYPIIDEFNFFNVYEHAFRKIP
ncbi:hypothetical protein [Aquiflexum gelatinilyticum]|uniref:Uncharacterized protein n=1 Tax=Aquiflexum gelatinilyticum TaxID=2961943 RepID=A0A9X2T1C2_9BACT|nr:hypothetical protein [Aquiflexum gelatinilyticum]MCR9015771.1 hypothetical protein [Aquiflexum gelatinilyticum]